MDVSSIDIARGRDYGLQPYYKFVEYCLQNASQIKFWKDLEQTIASNVNR